MSNRIATIGRYTVLEALRTRLPVLTLVTIGILLGAGFFVREIAVTDSTRFQTAFYAATVRFAAVFLAALHTITSVSRDFQDKGLDAVLALDLPRSHYVLGKLVGFIAIALALAVAAGVALVPLAGLDVVLTWTASLFLELTVIVALSLFCVVTFNSLMPAASFVIAFYLLARAITAMRLIGSNPISGADAASHQVMTWVVEGLALVVPPLDQWTRTEWLVDQAGIGLGFISIGTHTVLLATIFTAAAVFDMHRRNF